MSNFRGKSPTHPGGFTIVQSSWSIIIKKPEKAVQLLTLRKSRGKVSSCDDWGEVASQLQRRFMIYKEYQNL